MNHTESQRLFTVTEANAMLPLVRAIVRDMVQLAHGAVERRERLATLASKRSIGFFSHYRDELTRVEEESERDSERLQEYVDELRQLGVEPKSAMEGLVDFPAVREGRLIYLCWKLGEPEVGHWHELSAGFQGRQPLHVATSARIT